jgi:tRNA dimethylallyltransferase
MWYIVPELMVKTMHKNGDKIIVIVGPTASGKSDFGIKLSKKLNGEIISADSRQVYRGMDIGTGKVTKKEQKMAKHHLLDMANPKKQFTADDFKRLGEKAIKEIRAKGKIPIIVGGTGFYIDILLGRMATAQVPVNKKLRAKLEKQSAEQLFKRLLRLDLERAKTIDRHNRRRLIRALEIVITTGRPVPKAVSSIKYPVLWLGLRPEGLEKRIRKRLDARLKEEMIKEVARLHEEGLSWKRLDDFGLEYRWTSRWLKKSSPKAGKSNIPHSKFSSSDEYQNLLRDIIKYSKRQMTWFKRNKEIRWLDNNKTAERLARQFLK